MYAHILTKVNNQSLIACIEGSALIANSGLFGMSGTNKYKTRLNFPKLCVEKLAK